MKTSLFGLSLLALTLVCVFNIVMNTGCATKPVDQQSSFKLEGLERAAGPQSDIPVIY